MINRQSHEPISQIVNIGENDADSPICLTIVASEL